MVIRLINVSKHLILFIAIFVVASFAQGVPAGALLDAPSEPQEQQAVDLPTTSSASVPVKLGGTPAILISRPVYAPYSAEEKTMYISSVSQGYFYLKLSALTGYQVISMDKAAKGIPYYHDHTRRISRNAYIESAKRLGASYLLYQEYEPQGKKTRYNIEVISIVDNQRLVSKSLVIDMQQFESGLEEGLGAVVNALPNQISDYTREFFTTSVLGDNPKAVETFGNTFASISDFSEKRASGAIGELEKVLNGNSKFQVAKMLTAYVCAAGKHYDKAIEYQNELISVFGVSNPSLYLDLATYQVGAQNYDMALSSVDNAAKEQSLKLQAITARAEIYEAKGDYKKAQTYYTQLLSEGGENGLIYFKLALVNIALNNASGADSYLSKAQGVGYQLDRGSYYDIGMRYVSLSNNEKAIEAFKNSLGTTQDYEPAWQQLAKLYKEMGRKSDAAECYVSLFQINNNVYKDDLLLAGEIYEELNQTEKVKDVYSLFLARKFVNSVVSVKLAKLEAASGNCDKATDLVFGLDTISAVSADVRAINQQCGKPDRRVTIPTGSENRKTKPIVKVWRIASLVLAVGGAGAGYFFEKQVVAKQKDYSVPYDAGQEISVYTSNIEKLHKDIENAKRNRDLCYMGAGVGGLSLALSITLPIVFSNK
jgi:tetratricopeptide (TPR) repeat protein